MRALPLRHDRVGEPDHVDAVLEQRARPPPPRGARRRTSPARSGARPARRRSRAPSARARKRAVCRDSRSRSVGALVLQQLEHREARRPRSAARGCSRTGTAASAGAAARSISRRPLVKPPLAPPSALPSVPVMMSTRSSTPCSSGVPRPFVPTKPTACESSTITIASYFSARSQMRVERRDVAVHREHAVGGDQPAARVRRLAQALPRARPCRCSRSGSARPCRAGCRR